jgi:hypothetical protein
MKQIMPAGPQSVEVTLKEADGRATTFRRNLNIAATTGSIWRWAI